MNARALLLSLVLGLSAPALRAQTDDLAESFRQALFEEEGNRDFEKAIAAYEQVVEGYQTHRQMAASAVFRLAECHRKLDHKEEAARYYRQLLADFPAEETLAKLARENLAAMGEPAPAEVTGAPVKDPGISAEEQAELEHIQRLLAASPDLVLGMHPKDLNNAAVNGYLKVAELLLSKGLDVNETGDEMSPLTLAAGNGRLSMVNFLLEHGADIETTAGGEYTPLVEAISANRAAVAKSLLERGANPSAAISRGYDALAMASNVGNPEIVGWLIDVGVDVNVSVRKGETPLSIAIVRNALGAEPMKVARQLVDAGADPNGGDALHKVVERPDSEHLDRALAAAEFLLKAGADVNRKDANGLTPLHAAIAGRNPKKPSNPFFKKELAVLLLEHGADPLIPDNEGHDAVYKALGSNSLELLELFMERGVDLKASAPQRLGTALVVACAHGDIDLTRWLLEVGADPNSTDGGNSLLNIAVSRGNIDLVKLLLGAGADPNNGGERNPPPLFKSIDPIGNRVDQTPEANIALIRLLVEAGADPNRLNESGETVLHQLVSGNRPTVGDERIAVALLESGANPRIADRSGKAPVASAGNRNDRNYTAIWKATYYEDPARPEGIWASIPSQKFEKIFSAKRGGTSTLRLSDFLVSAMANHRVPDAIADPWTFRILRHASGETEPIDMAAWADGKIEDPILAWGDIVEMATGESQTPGVLAWEKVDPEAGERTRILVERLRKKFTLQVHGKTLEYTSGPLIQNLVIPPFIDPTRREVRSTLFGATMVEDLVRGLRQIDPTISPRFRIENAETGSNVTLDLSQNPDGTPSGGTPLLSRDTLILEAPGFEDPALAAATAGVITISREEDGFLAVIRPDTFPVTVTEMLAEAFRLHALSHPDLERIVVIRNPVPEGQGDLEATATDGPAPAVAAPAPTRHELPLNRIMAAPADGIPAKDIPGFMLQAGDRIEIPALSDAEGDWTGVDEEVARFFQDMARAEVTISVLGAADRKVLLAPRFPVYETRFGLATLIGTRSPLGAAVDAGSRWLAEALHELGYLRDKFDFRKVELVGAAADPRFFDLTQQAQPQPQPQPPVWLRDGDRLSFLARDEAAQQQSPQGRRVVLPPGG